MEVIEGGAASVGPSIEITFWQRLVSSVKGRLIRLRRKLPYLVWWNDELDVSVTLLKDKLLTDDASVAFRDLNSGTFAEVEKKLSEAGIHFDKGLGPEGRDWEWDWSLVGPINIRFRGRAKYPELRKERPRPQLVVQNNPPPAA
jgi:hypothetical protein